MNDRLVRVAELLKRELSRCIEREFEFTDVLVTIHEVRVTPDLRNAHVFVGFVGEESRRREATRLLNSRRNRLQNEVMKRVVLKYTPILHFHEDHAVERGVKVVSLLDELADRAPTEGEGDDTGDLDSDRQLGDGLGE